MPSDGIRLEASLVTPAQGEAWPWAVLNPAGRNAKDAVFFDGFVAPLLERGFAVCRYEPRQPQSDFWTRWSDLSALLQHVARDFEMRETALAGTGLGAILSMWWAVVNKSAAVISFGMPAPAKLGTVPRVMHDYLPPEQHEDELVPHPTNVANFLALVGERDTGGMQRAETFGATVIRIASADKNFSGVRTRQVAFERAASWLSATLQQNIHEREAAPEPGRAQDERRQEEQ